MADKLGMQIGIKDTTEIKCEVCGCNVFEEGVMLRRVSGLLTGTGREGILPIPVFMCSKCGHINQEFLPRELQVGNEQQN